MGWIDSMQCAALVVAFLMIGVAHDRVARLENKRDE